jgi:hypothetical protein
MASPIAKFDAVASGSLTTTGTDNWVDLTTLLFNAGFIPSPVIPSGKQIWIAYITCISADKNAQFEMRPNKTTKSAANTTDTDLRGFASVPTGESSDLDVYYGGAINTFAPVDVASTGVEKLWLRIKCGSNAAATYEYILYCTII